MIVILIVREGDGLCCWEQSEIRKGRTIYFCARTREIEDSFAFRGIDSYFQLDGAAVVHVIYRAQILAFEALVDIFKQVLDAELRIILDVAHVELYDFFVIVFDQCHNQIDAFLVRSDLRFQVVYVVGQTAGA